MTTSANVDHIRKKTQRIKVHVRKRSAKNHEKKRTQCLHVHIFCNVIKLCWRISFVLIDFLCSRHELRLPYTVIKVNPINIK